MGKRLRRFMIKAFMARSEPRDDVSPVTTNIDAGDGTT
jgi:hypothetical protein